MLNLTEVELVLDPFMGSGTVGRVCDKLERDFVGYDLKNYWYSSSLKTKIWLNLIHGKIFIYS